MALKMQKSAEAPAAAAEGKGGGKANMLPIIIAVVIVAVAAVVGVIVMKSGAKKSDAPKVLKVGEIIPLDEFMMNLADPSNSHYVKTTIALGMVDGITSESFKEKVPQTRDAIVMVLSAKHLADLQTEAGKVALKTQIQDSVNKSLGAQDVAAVYIEDFATQ